MTHPVRRRAIVLAAGMGAAALLGGFASTARRPADLPRLDLDRLFPKQFGPWQIDPVAAAFVQPAAERGYKIYEQVLERVFIDAAGRRVMLSVAYGSDQSSGLELHWPEICYRFGGFAVRSRHLAQVRGETRMLAVTRLVAELPGRPEPVTYWTVLGGERVPDANTFRLRRLRQAVRREVVSGMLVRVSSIDPDDARAFALHDTFIVDLERALSPEDRAKVIGIPPLG